jgi:cation diffusion facilitator CzcD-associated flavoprotein CzcO
MRKQIKDPALLKLVTPDFPIGCKRLIISDDYLPALCRPNASLIPSALDRFTPSGIRTAAGQDIGACVKQHVGLREG